MKRYIRSDEEYSAGGETFDGYMGAVGWKGKNYELHRDVKDIAQIVRKQFKQKFPGYKISVRISRFSGGQAIDATIWLHTSDLISKQEFVDDAVSDPYQFARGGGMIGYIDENGRYQWVDSYQLFNNMDEAGLEQFFANYYDRTIEKYSEGSNTYPTINYGQEPIPLKNKKPLEYVKGLLDSFNYADSNSMVDYFAVNFYSDIEYKYD